MKRIEIQLGLLTIDMFNTHPMGTYIYPYWTLEEVYLNLAWNMHPHGVVTIPVQYQLTTKFPLYCLVSSGNNNLERTVIH